MSAVAARPLAPRDRALAALVVALALADEARAKRALRAFRRARGRRRAAEEAILMLVLYRGFPAALEGMRFLAREWPGRANRSDRGTPGLWRRRGLALSRRVYGEVHPKLVATVEGFHPDLATWMIEHGYGRVLARAGLSARTRELLTVAVLAATGWERQLVSHLHGARRVGAGERALAAAWKLGAGRAHPHEGHGVERAWRAFVAVNQV